MILADEPTGGLDSSNPAQVRDLLCEFKREKGLTVIMVTHDAEVSACADRAIHVRNGRLDLREDYREFIWLCIRQPVSAAGAHNHEQALKAFPHVQAVVGLPSEILSVSDNAPPVFVFGWAYGRYLWDHLTLVDGRWPSADTEPVVVIGSFAAELLHKKIDDTLEIEGRQFRFAGIFESSAVVENGTVLMTLHQAQQVTDKPGKVNVLNITLDGHASEADVEELKAHVRATMPRFVAITSGELVSNNTIVRISKAMSNATILIAGLVGTLVVFNTMLMSINERKRDIGVLLALGWQRRMIVELVSCEAVILTLADGAFGIAAGNKFQIN